MGFCYSLVGFGFAGGCSPFKLGPPNLPLIPSICAKERGKNNPPPPHERGRETVARCLSGPILAASWPGDKCLMMMIEIYRFEAERVHRKYSEGH